MELHPADALTDDVYHFADAKGAGPRPGGSDHTAPTMEAAPVVVEAGGQSGGNGVPTPAPGSVAVAGAGPAPAASPPPSSSSTNGTGGGSGPEVPAQAASTPTAAPKGAKLRPRRRARVRLDYLLQAWSFSLVVHAAILSALAFATFGGPDAVKEMLN